MKKKLEPPQGFAPKMDFETETSTFGISSINRPLYTYLLFWSFGALAPVRACLRVRAQAPMTFRGGPDAHGAFRLGSKAGWSTYLDPLAHKKDADQLENSDEAADPKAAGLAKTSNLRSHQSSFSRVGSWSQNAKTVERLPPAEERLFTGTVRKKVVASKTQGKSV